MLEVEKQEHLVRLELRTCLTSSVVAAAQEPRDRAPVALDASDEAATRNTWERTELAMPFTLKRDAGIRKLQRVDTNEVKVG